MMRTWMMLGVVFACLFSGDVNGQTWDGGGTTNNWTDANNWSPNSVPVNNGTASITFAGSTRLAPFLNTSFDVRRVTFDDTAGAFNVSGAGGAVLTVRVGGITNNRLGVTETIGVAMSVAESQTWRADGPLTASGFVNLGANTLTLDNSATIALTNVVFGTGAIVKEGSGAVLLSGANTFSGGVTLNLGTLGIGAGSGLGTGVLTINGGNMEAVGGNRTIANSVVMNQNLSIISGAALTMTGPLTLTGNRTLTNGISNLAISGALGEDAPGRELTLGGGGTLTLSGSALTLGTSLKHSSGTLTATGLINTPGHTLTQNGGTFTGSLVNRGTFVYNGGAHSGNIANEAGGDATINANLTLTTALNNFGTVHVANSRTLAFGTQQLNNAGTIELTGGTLSANASTQFASSGVMSGYGTISTTGTSFSNSGLVSVSGGNLTFASNVGFANSGTINVPTGRQLQWNSTEAFGNVGLMQLAGGSIGGTGPLTNSSGGEIRGSGTVQSVITNSGGLIRATGTDPLTIADLSGNNTGSGELRVDEGATMNVQTHFVSSSTIVLGGPNANLNLVSATITGTLRGQGRVTGTVQNGSIVRAEGGTLTLAGSSNTNTAAGRLESGAGTQLLYTQGLATNAGLIALTGGTFDNNNKVTANPGRIEGYGTLRTGAVTNTGAISVAGSLDVFGVVTNNGVVSTAAGSTVRFFGPVSGPGAFTGTGTVTFLDTFSPGASPAAVNFGGDVTLAGASSLVIELAGTAPGSQYDTLAAAGDVTLAGALDVDLLDGYTPAPGSVFQIVSAAGGVDGQFSGASLPSLVGASWQLRYDSNAVLLQVAPAGDYNFDGRVDAADYTLWRDSLGQNGAALAADGDGNGQVDAADYGVWKSHFGLSIAGGAGGSIGIPASDGAAVAEPATAFLLMASALATVAARRRSKLGRRYSPAILAGH